MPAGIRRARTVRAPVVLTPASNVQAAIDANPGNTHFLFSAGTYTGISLLSPKSGNILDGGNQGAVIDGQNVLEQAIVSETANNVTVRGFVIKQYATPLQQGAVHCTDTTGWVIENNHVTLNAEVGVASGSGARVMHNLIDHNGRAGFSAHGSNVLYENNEIAFNNENLIADITFEAGGGKLWNTTNATFRGNNVHDNGGHGLWDDTNNIYVVYDGNTVTNNTCSGIYHEIGYEATIVNNTVSGNGMPASPGGGQNLGWMWDAGIQIRTSRPVNPATPILVENNIVTNNCNGISLIDSPAGGAVNPGESAFGALYLADITVNNNTITMSKGASGVVQDGRGNTVFAQNLVWTNNDYIVAATHEGGDVYNWHAWLNVYHNFAPWQSYGHDTAGSSIIA